MIPSRLQSLFRVLEDVGAQGFNNTAMLALDAGMGTESLDNQGNFIQRRTSVKKLSNLR